MALVADCMYVSSWQLKSTSSTLILLPVAIHQTSVALRVWLMKMAYYLSLSILQFLLFIYLFQNPSNSLFLVVTRPI